MSRSVAPPRVVTLLVLAAASGSSRRDCGRDLLLRARLRVLPRGAPPRRRVARGLGVLPDPRLRGRRRLGLSRRAARAGPMARRRDRPGLRRGDRALRPEPGCGRRGGRYDTWPAAATEMSSAAASIGIAKPIPSAEVGGAGLIP